MLVEVHGKSYHDRANKVTSINIMILQSHEIILAVLERKGF